LRARRPCAGLKRLAHIAVDFRFVVTPPFVRRPSAFIVAASISGAVVGTSLASTVALPCTSCVATVALALTPLAPTTVALALTPLAPTTVALSFTPLAVATIGLSLTPLASTTVALALTPFCALSEVSLIGIAPFVAAPVLA
jgi:hypothetical protein